MTALNIAPIKRVFVLLDSEGAWRDAGGVVAATPVPSSAARGYATLHAPCTPLAQ